AGKANQQICRVLLRFCEQCVIFIEAFGITLGVMPCFRQSVARCVLVALLWTGFAVGGQAGDWWSLRPLERPAVPPVSSARVSNPIDHFLLRKLQGAGLGFSPEASRRTLMRRIYFDLTGLPPSPEAARRFERDPDP